jgi:choline dehydrogenase-like flavoprotein
VVGTDARVHGTENVFVADASVIPVIPRAPINATCMVLGLRVADLLLTDVR